jgi:hypothetical protein
MVVEAIQKTTHNLTSLDNLSLFADVGHRLYWLWLSEAAFFDLPDEPLLGLQDRVLTQSKARGRLAAVMGGTTNGICVLQARPCGKLMMFVALGIVYRCYGYAVAAAWLQGGYRVLEQMDTRE